MNTAIFSVVRGVLLRPLMNRDEDRLIYIQQSAPGLQVSNATFSIPEVTDIGAHLKTISQLGTFSTVDFSADGIGTAREIHAGVVDGAYFNGAKACLGSPARRKGRYAQRSWRRSADVRILVRHAAF